MLPNPNTSADQYRDQALGMRKTRQRFVVVHNANAGKNGQQLTDRVIKELRKLGAEVELAPLGLHDSHLHDVLACADVVVASGGDGTIRRLAQIVAPLDLPLGVIPNGTGNVLAEELRLPRSPSLIARYLMEGSTVRVRGGRANGTPFFLMCGVGFDGAVVDRLNDKVKKRFGKAAFALPILAALRDKPRMFATCIDGINMQASSIVITNAQRYAGSFKIQCLPGVQDHSFHALVSTAGTRRERILEFLALVIGKIDYCKTIRLVPCMDLKISSDIRISVQVDGDSCSAIPLTFDARGPEVLIICPTKAERP